MKLRPFVVTVVLTSVAASANAAFVKNTYHVEGTFNTDGGGFTEIWTNKPNSHALESLTFDWKPFVESHRIPLTITIPTAPTWAETFASAIFAGGTIRWAELSTTVEPVATDCGGSPCPYSGVFTIGHSQEILMSDPVDGSYHSDVFVWLGSALAGKSFDVEVTLWAPTIERVIPGENAKTTFKMWGPTSYSIDVITSTEYLGTPEPSTAAMLVIYATGLLAGWAARNQRRKAMKR
jgi:hypothetical protein